MSTYAKDFLSKVVKREEIEVEGTRFEVRQLKSSTLLSFISASQKLGITDETKPEQIDFSQMPLELLCRMVAETVLEPGTDNPVFEHEEVANFPLNVLTQLLNAALSLSKLSEEGADDLKDG